MPKVQAEERLYEFRALIDGLAVNGFGLVQPSAHSDMMSSLSREQKADAPIRPVLAGRHNLLGVAGLQYAHQILPVAADDDAAMRELLAPDFEGVSGIGQTEMRVGLERLLQIRSRLFQGRIGFSRKHQELIRSCSLVGLDAKRLF